MPDTLIAPTPSHARVPLTPSALRSLTGSPLDPNFAPPTRPPSALSTTSDASYFALYDEPATPSYDGSGTLPRRTVFATIRRHGQQCLLCGGGRKEVGELVVMRALAGQDGEGTLDPIARLKDLKLLAHGYTREDWTNLMTLCRPHADAYDAGAWRWLPNAAFREQLFTAAPSTLEHDNPMDDNEDEDEEGDVTMTDQDDAERDKSIATQTSTQTQDGLDHPVGAAETLVDDGISGDTRNPEISFRPVELPKFDVLILNPSRMPPASSMQIPAPGQRVWRDWKTLTLNPYVVFSAALPLLGVGDGDGLGEIAKDCAAVRERWERALGGL